MDALQNILHAEIIQKLGWTLLHFVWQAAAIGLLLAIVLRLMRKFAANLRYIAACAAMATLVALPAITIQMVEVDTPIEITPPANRHAVDLPQTVIETAAITGISETELPQAQAAVINEAPLTDRFIMAIEPALPFAVIVWLAGVFGLSIWHLGGWAQLQKLRRQMVRQVEPSLKANLRRLSDAMGISKAVDLMESALVQVPAVIGHFKPLILLPVSALTGLSTEQIEAVLAHELAHIKRNDYLVNMLQTVVEILGFYHPAVWWVSRKIRVERENCCDDMAVGVSGDKVGYVRTLALLEEIRAAQPGLAVAASGASLFDRIKRLLGKDASDDEKANWLPSVVAVLLIAALLIPTAVALNGNKLQDTENNKTQQLQQLVEEAYQSRYFVRLVIGEDAMTFQGKQTKWNDLPSLLQQIPNRKNTVFEVGFVDVPEDFWNTKTDNPAWQKADKLQDEFGFEYLSFVGKHDLGDMPGGTRNYLYRPMAFNKQILTGVPSAEDKPLLNLQSVEFNKDQALIIASVLSYPKKQWDIELAFFDENLQRLNYVFKKYENSGTVKGIPLFSEEIITVDIKDVKGLEKAEFFEISIKQTEQKRVGISDSERQSSFEIEDVSFEPIHQGKNLLRIKVQNKSDEEQVFAVHIYSRSVDYGDGGMGWGRPFFTNIQKGETKVVSFPFAIQGPVTNNTWLRLKFYNPESVEAYDYEKAFWEKRYSSNELKQANSQGRLEQTSKPVYETLSQIVEDIQHDLLQKQYEDAWLHFSEDYKKVQFQTKGLERFKQAMEPEQPIYTAFTWKKNDFLDLKPQVAFKKNDKLILQADSAGSTWTIDFVEEDGQWKIDWIAGYRPGLFDMQEEDGETIANFKEKLEKPVTANADKSPDGNRLTVQYAMMAICEAAKVPYNWDKSMELVGDKCRMFTEPIDIKEKPASDAIKDVINAAGLDYDVDADGVYLYKARGN